MENDSGREVTIFIQALEIPPRDREAFLQRTCGADHELRRRVEALLGAHDRMGKFLEEQAPDLRSHETD